MTTERREQALIWRYARQQRLLSELTKTLPPLTVYDVVRIQNQHWPQPALHPEPTPLIGWGTHDNLPHSLGLPTQGQAGEDSISNVPDEQIEVGHTPQVPEPSIYLMAPRKVPRTPLVQSSLGNPRMICRLHHRLHRDLPEAGGCPAGLHDEQHHQWL